MSSDSDSDPSSGSDSDSDPSSDSDSDSGSDPSSDSGSDPSSDSGSDPSSDSDSDPSSDSDSDPSSDSNFVLTLDSYPSTNTSDTPSDTTSDTPSDTTSSEEPVRATRGKIILNHDVFVDEYWKCGMWGRMQRRLPESWFKYRSPPSSNDTSARSKTRPVRQPTFKKHLYGRKKDHKYQYLDDDGCGLCSDEETRFDDWYAAHPELDRNDVFRQLEAAREEYADQMRPKPTWERPTSVNHAAKMRELNKNRRQAKEERRAPGLGRNGVGVFRFAQRPERRPKYKVAREDPQDE